MLAPPTLYANEVDVVAYCDVVGAEKGVADAAEIDAELNHRQLVAYIGLA